jgi:hypothetical protein
VSWGSCILSVDWGERQRERERETERQRGKRYRQAVWVNNANLMQKKKKNYL